MLGCMELYGKKQTKKMVLLNKKREICLFSTFDILKKKNSYCFFIKQNSTKLRIVKNILY